jgi:hypothetical protein
MCDQPPDDEIDRLRRELVETADIVGGIDYCYREHLVWMRQRADEIASEMEWYLGRIDQLLMRITALRMQKERSEDS